ncbi:MAG: hypothetical protein JRF59_13410 [Deltaproteobacteria bacterium]|nr:hypothetical protein [Deltaproteobacteria bacterium]MBW1923947.1 hypothetical protein [Deltaproteobacteria bacterium]MBW1950892.1 hypothetical protein [Deltaproteobacteria bacterium]MBW2009067.1 hypothetical protein [Deltaproteobacteria bacterium]MBW2103350.1 hypothetical protein [Deltaproteobacteria bacterium]
MSRKMKIKLKVYEYKGMLKKTFDSVMEAQEMAERMARRHPDKIFKHHIVYDDSEDFQELSTAATASIDMSEFYEEAVGEPDPDRLAELNDFDIFKDD